jgi:hypothetical protein
MAINSDKGPKAFRANRFSLWLARLRLILFFAVKDERGKIKKVFFFAAFLIAGVSRYPA